MDEIILINVMATLIILASFTSIVLGKLRLPPLIGFLVTGILIANYVEVTEDMDEVVEIFSNLGLIFLMFTLGLEIDVNKLRIQGKFAIIIASVLVPIMFISGLLTGYIIGLTLVQSLVLGAIISGSSTAVVVAVQKSTNVLDHDSVEVIVLIMIIEDICQVLMLSILTPVLSGGDMDTNALALLIGSIAVFMILCLTLGLKVIPKAIDWIYERSNADLIALFSVGLLFAFALMANYVGLSVAIGAFLAGAIVGTSRPKEAVAHFTEPLKTMFMAMFFISVGMQVSIDGLTSNILMIFVIYAMFATSMFVAVNLGYWVGNGDPRNGWVTALSLCTMGEFAFIISKEALDYGVIDQSLFSSIIGAAIVSMIVLPTLVRNSGKSYRFVDKKCPRPIHNAIDAINGVRDTFYFGIEVVSTRTRERFTRSLMRAPVLVFLVIVIEIFFYLIYDPMSLWLYENVGVIEEYQWRQVILAANIFVLLEPCRRIARFLRMAMYILARGQGKKGSRRTNPLTTLLIGAAITLVIVIVVPNGIDNASHVILLIAMLGLILLMRYKEILNEKDPNQPPPGQPPEPPPEQ